MMVVQSSRKKTDVLSPCCLMVRENAMICVGFLPAGFKVASLLWCGQEDPAGVSSLSPCYRERCRMPGMLWWLRELPCPPTSREHPSCCDDSVLSSALCHRVVVSQEHCAHPVSAYSQAQARTVVTRGTFEEVTGSTSVSRGYTSKGGLPPTRGYHPFRPRRPTESLAGCPTQLETLIPFESKKPGAARQIV